MARTAIPTPIRHGWALLVCAALPAFAQTLGDIEVRSAPGEPLDATIALGTAAGTAVGAECVFLSRGAPEDGPFITRGRIAVYEEGGARFIRLKSSEPVAGPARLRVVIQCPGLPHVAYREYRALFAPPPALSPVQPPTATPSGNFPVRSGDSLESLAALMFPRQRDTQRAYIEALRERNPALASLGPREPIPADAAIELPDLRALPKARAQPPSPPRIAEAVPPPPPRDMRPPAPAPKAEPKRQAVVKAEPAPRAAAAPSRPAAAPGASRADAMFSLRLSSGEIDLTRSRGIDDAQRAKLRERLLVLDNDDQVSALLALRDSLKRLEGRVAELQLKLSGMPATMPAAPRAEPPATKAAPVLPAKAESPPKVEALPPRVEAPAPKIETPAPKVEAPAPKIETPAPKVEIAPVAKSEPAPPPKPEARVVPPEPRPQAVKKPASADWGFALSDALWGVVALLVLLAIAFAWHLARRRRALDVEEALPEIPSSLPPATTEPRAESAGGVDFDVAEPVALARPAARREIASDAGLATDVPSGDPATLRRRYIEQRFPEIASGVIALSDPDSVVKAARLFYEDGALPRAVELLQYATEENPDHQKPWLALFEIFRLERLKGQFADLAQRFRDRHGHEGNWRKVQFFGREIDPGNALYRDLSVGIETIKFEAGAPPAPVTFDPVAENWLNAPMDFENELLMADLRRALMEQAQVSDADLTPNPMPALRRVEMFTVA